MTVTGTAIDTSSATRQICSYTLSLMSILENYIQVLKSENRENKKYSFYVRYLVTTNKSFIFIVDY